MHIGSQIREITPFIEAVEITRRLFERYQQRGFSLTTLDIGGGVGISYESDCFAEDEALLKSYGEAVSLALKGFEGRVLCEPGRILVGRFGLLLTQVEYIKSTPFKNFAIVNTGMHHNMRPALYQAHHRILPVINGGGSLLRYDVVGPICESADVLGFDRMLPHLKEGDWLALADCGAYGAVMASGYNAHKKPDEVVLWQEQVLLTE